MASVQNSSRRGKKPRADGTPVSEEVMEELQVDYDRFDEKSNVQVFIDRHHRVVESDHVASESEPDELQGSVHSLMDEQTRNIKAMCAVLLKDQKKRTPEEIESIMPFFMSFKGLQKLRESSAEYFTQSIKQ